MILQNPYKKERRSGVLLHPSSLWGDYSIGSLGKESYEFSDFLSECGFSVWQTLPFCIPDEYNSPYKSPAAFSLNPYLIDLPTLHGEGYITESELLSARQSSPYLCEFPRLKDERMALLFSAAERASHDSELISKIDALFDAWPELSAAAEFLSLLELNGGLPWQKWKINTPDPKRLFGWKFIHYEFFMQWMRLKEYANSKGIEIIGDMPIYVDLNSSDVWSSPESFLLDDEGFPRVVAGVPPDYFSEDGQMWGNPIYNYRNMKRDGFSFWKRRIEFLLTLFDGIRIDHFRAFESFYTIPADAKNARSGKWQKGPGRAIIDAIKSVSDGKYIIAEDLGVITDKVDALRRYSGFPGMKVLQFAFLGDADSPHLPHNFDKNTVAYTGTHDNNTLYGFLAELDEGTRAQILEYFGCHGKDLREAAVTITAALLATSADTVILPIQDLLAYGRDTRMNTPGKSDGNWAYRLTREQLFEIDRQKYCRLNRLYGRI